MISPSERGEDRDAYLASHAPPETDSTAFLLNDPSALSSSYYRFDFKLESSAIWTSPRRDRPLLAA